MYLKKCTDSAREKNSGIGTGEGLGGGGSSHPNFLGKAKPSPPNINVSCDLNLVNVVDRNKKIS